MEIPNNLQITRKKKRNVQYTEETLRKALNDIRKEGKGIRETCRLYQIPRTTIQDRLSGRRSDSIETKPGPDPVLGTEGENQIKEWLLAIAKCGFPVKKQELLDSVQKIVKDRRTKNPFKNDRPGQTWYFNFLKRHPDISPARIKKARVNKQSIRVWFTKLEEFLTETNNEDILECGERIFNGDECGFFVCPKTGQVLAPKGYSNSEAGNEMDSLTVLFTFNALGQLSPPLVVFPYKLPPRAVVESMPEDWSLGTSERGEMRSDIFLEYVTNDFNDWLGRNCIKRPILLLIDGHKSHMSLVLSATCEKLGIILYALPPNMTQPAASNQQPSAATVSVFAPLKSSWEAVVRKFLSENVNSCVNKTNFCQLFRNTLEDTKMNTDIKIGFRECGLYPFDPDALDYSKQSVYVQNTLESAQESTHISKEIYFESSTDVINEDHAITNKDLVITKKDLASTRKVLKHLRPVLTQNNINVSVILKELRKLQPKQRDSKTENNETDQL